MKVCETDENIETLKAWLREYKKCEAEGKEYYFIYAMDGTQFGVNRIYYIQDTYCT
jgi:hypothetical protein